MTAALVFFVNGVFLSGALFLLKLVFVDWCSEMCFFLKLFLSKKKRFCFLCLELCLFV